MLATNSLIQTGSDGVLVLFGFRLPQGQEADAISISNRIAEKEPVKYRLDTHEHIPLVRLYEAVFPEKNVTEVFNKVEKLAKAYPPIVMKWSEIEESEEIVILWGELNEQLHDFQLTLMMEVNDDRDGFYKQKYNMYQLEPSKQASLEQWGWVWASEYVPYVIVSQPKSEFMLRDFEVGWEHQNVLLDTLVMAQKPEPGRLVQRKEIVLTA